MSSAKPFARALLAAIAILLPTVNSASASELNVGASVQRVLELTNIERQKAGVPPLTLSSELTAAAQSYSETMGGSGCFSHSCGAVPNFADRISMAGYGGMMAAAENIAAGYPSPEAVVDGWMNSPGHRENLLNPSYTEIGIGVAQGGGRFGLYWTQDFGSRGWAAAAPAAEPSDEGE